MKNEKTIIRQLEDNIDGIVYIVSVYSDGSITKARKPGYENAITNTEERQLELEANIQYLVDLAEINEESL